MKHNVSRAHHQIVSSHGSSRGSIYPSNGYPSTISPPIVSSTKFSPRASYVQPSHHVRHTPVKNYHHEPVAVSYRHVEQLLYTTNNQEKFVHQLQQDLTQNILNLYTMNQ